MKIVVKSLDDFLSSTKELGNKILYVVTDEPGGTKVEAEAIATMLNITPLIGAEATSKPKSPILSVEASDRIPSGAKNKISPPTSAIVTGWIQPICVVISADLKLPDVPVILNILV